MMDQLDRRHLVRRLLPSLVFPVGLGAVAGVPGVLVGGLAALVAYKVGAEFGFLLAQFGFLLAAVSIETAIFVEAFLAIPLLVTLSTTFELQQKQWATIAALSAVILVPLTALVYAGPWTLFISTLVGLVVLSLLLYGIHRYEILELGLVSEGTL